MNEAFIKVLADLLGRISSKYTEDITYTSGTYSKSTGFFLYVGVEGNVVFKDMRGIESTRHLVAGYHPIQMTEITETGTTATDLGACFN